MTKLPVVRSSRFKLNFVRTLRLISILPLFVPAATQAQTNVRDPYKWSWKLSQGWPDQPSLKTARLSSMERNAVLKASFNAFVSDKNWSQIISSKSEWRRAIWQARIKLVDLDGDGIPEVLLMGGGLESSGDGNSSFRILKKQGNRYKILFDGIAEHVNFDLRFDPKRPAVVLYTHAPASDGGLELYQIGLEGGLNNTANFFVTWPAGKSAFEATPALERTDHRSMYFDH